MQYYVTITSQGQITIPVQLQKEVGLTKGKKAIINTDNGQAIIKPVPDIMELRGVFKTKKRFSRRLERRAAERAWANGTV